jgi:DNA-binding XRE family transcriptional regulator
MNRKEFGQNVRQTRRELGIRQDIMASKCGVSCTSIQQIETGALKVSKEMMFKICDILGPLNVESVNHQ